VGLDPPHQPLTFPHLEGHAVQPLFGLAQSVRIVLRLDPIRGYDLSCAVNAIDPVVTQPDPPVSLRYHQGRYGAIHLY